MGLERGLEGIHARTHARSHTHCSLERNAAAAQAPSAAAPCSQVDSWRLAPPRPGPDPPLLHRPAGRPSCRGARARPSARP